MTPRAEPTVKVVVAASLDSASMHLDADRRHEG
jgi:hypothetical protein